MEKFFLFGKTVTAFAHPALQKAVLKELWHSFCCGAGEIRIRETEDPVFRIGAPEKAAPSGESLFCVEENGVILSAGSEKELVRLFLDLLTRIKVLETAPGREEFALPLCDGHPAPAIARRMIHFCVFPETTLFEFRRFVRFCGVLGYTHFIPEFWGSLRFDALKELAWPSAFSKEEVAPILTEARDLGMEIVPMFNHWGHASASRVRHGKHVVLDQDLRYQPYFSADGWTWNIEKREVRDLLGAVRRELHELCGPGEFFHLGCDEAYNFPVTAENAGTVTGYLNGIAEELGGLGRRPIVWGDMFVSKRADFDPENRYTASARDPAAERALLSGLSKRVILADWQYRVRRAPVETALIFKKAGFDVILCPWDLTPGCDSVTPCAETVKNEALFGLMHTTWHTLSRGMPVVLRASRLCLGAPLPPVAAPVAADLLRKSLFPGGSFEKAGFAASDLAADPG